MRKIFLWCALFCSLFWFSYAVEDHAFSPDLIDVSVSPLRFEIQWAWWQTLTKTIKVINNSEFPISFTSSIESCTTKDTNGTPDCKIPSIWQDPVTSIALWSSISPSTFSVPANSETNVTLAINVPNNAPPWGHYGAVFFSTGKKQWQIISTVKRIGVLILFTVPGDIVIDNNVSNINISVSGWDGGWWWIGEKSIVDTIKKTVFWVQKELIDGANDIKTIFESEEEINSKKPDIQKETKKDDTKVSFDITFQNDGNTHIKPSGKIEVLDDGKAIPKISKELIKNDSDAIIWEKLVDYIPINDQWWNVLPGSKRDFFQEWRGFPYEIVNEKGEKEIRYRSFSEYYSNQNLSERKILMFWEQVKTRDKTKWLSANIQLKYPGKDGKDEEFNSAREFEIRYKEEYIGKNWFILSILWVLWSLWAWWIRIALRRRKRNDAEFQRLKKKLKEQEKEIDIIEDLVEHIPTKTRKKIIGKRSKKEKE